MTIKYVGIDPNGIPRVRGLSETLALQAAKEYLARRPDCGPLIRWQVRKEPIARVEGAFNKDGSQVYIDVME